MIGYVIPPRRSQCRRFYHFHALLSQPRLSIIRDWESKELRPCSCSGPLSKDHLFYTDRIEKEYVYNEVFDVNDPKNHEVFDIRKTPWYNHPACKMWRGNERSLIRYGVIICSEWIGRGYKDTCLGKIEQFRPYFTNESDPSWLGNVEFHLSHQSNLIRKDAVFYGDKFPGVPSNLEYVWPCG